MTSAQPMGTGSYHVYSSQPYGTEIRSYFAAPQDRVPAPGVLILRGIAGPDAGYTEIADRLAQSGYGALVHNWQTRGNDPDDRTLIADIRGGLAFLSRRKEIDSARLAVFGYCKGGGQALLAAAECPQIRAIVAFHGFARRPHGADEDHRNPIEVAGRIRRPVLLLHGERDQLSPIGAMRELSDALKKAEAQVEMHIYQGADHGFAVSTHKGFKADAAADSFSRAIAFLSKHLG